MKAILSQIFLLVMALAALTACQQAVPQNAGETTQVCDCDYPPSLTPDRIILTYAGDPSTSQAVSWRTSPEVEEAFAEIALATASPDLAERARRLTATTTPLETDVNVAHFHTVDFTGLTPGTQYAYRVGDGEIWSEWSHFETASDQAAPFSFLYFGDAQNDIKSMWSRTIREAFITMPKADFLLHAGDLVNRANSDNEWGEWFYAGGWIYATMPSLATPGNHEYTKISDDTRILTTHWKPTFAFPENGPEAFSESVYYIDYQGARIISLNSQGAFVDPETGKEQVSWLEEVLENNPHPWTVITHHHPIYSTKFGRDNKEWREALQPLYEKYQVDLVLQGHDHTYGRGRNLLNGMSVAGSGGPIYVVSVSGPKMYDLGLDEWMERGASNTQLYQLIHVAPEKIRFEAYTVTGQLYDAFEILRGANGEKTYVDKTPEEVPELLELPGRFKEQAKPEDLEAYQERFRKYKARKEKVIQ